MNMRKLGALVLFLVAIGNVAAGRLEWLSSSEVYHYSNAIIAALLVLVSFTEAVPSYVVGTQEAQGRRIGKLEEYMKQVRSLTFLGECDRCGEPVFLDETCYMNPEADKVYHEACGEYVVRHPGEENEEDVGQTH